MHRSPAQWSASIRQTNRWWMTVDSLDFTSGDEGVPVVFGRAFRIIDPPNPLPAGSPACERLSFEIWVRTRGRVLDQPQRSRLSQARTSASGRSCRRTKKSIRTLIPRPRESPQRCSGSRLAICFAFHSPAFARDEIYFPLLMPGLAENYLGAVELNGTQRNVTASPSLTALFFDRDLVEASTSVLATTADFLQYLSPRPRRLTGMHAAFPLEEATIIAVPDAVHGGWTREELQELPQPRASPPPLRPEWWHFLDCNPAPKKTRAEQLRSRAARAVADQTGARA